MNKQKAYIAYTLNILGIRVFNGWCQLIARHGEEWVEIGVRRMLPIDLSEGDPRHEFRSGCPYDPAIPLSLSARWFDGFGSGEKEFLGSSWGVLAP